MSVWLAETLIATTLLMALVMLLRRPVARWLGAGVAYWLWALPFARMILPALPQEIVQPSPLHMAVDQAGLPALLAAAKTQQAIVIEQSFPWLEVAVALWLVGTILFVTVHLAVYFRFRRDMLRGATPVGQEGRIRLIASPNASGPLAFGVLTPYIVLPADFTLRYDPLEQDMAIAHERAHHDHADLAANMVALLLLAIHWCNPVAWIAYRAYRADQETACDARVLALYGRENAHAYGRAILKTAGGRQFAAACHLTRITTLKGRLKMLSTHEHSLRQISWGMAAIALVTAAGLAMTASGSRAAQQMAVLTDRVEATDFSRLTHLVAQPAAASAPAVAPAVATVPETPAVPTASAAAAWPEPSVPAAPPVPAADMIAPMAPVPPAPPVSSAWPETLRVPTQADIARMVPRVDVRNGCDGSDMVSHRETTGSDGRRNIRIRICEAAIARTADHARAQADRAARAADRASLQADRAARQADRDRINADHMARNDHAEALAGLRSARAQIASDASMPAFARTEALREIDRSIAEIRKGQD